MVINNFLIDFWEYIIKKKKTLALTRVYQVLVFASLY
jgi:hypothetical protein